MSRMVSVIMPTRNDAGTIAEAAQSVLQQTHQDLELIVVDDGSAYETADIVRAVVDPRVALLSNPHSGPAATRNQGLRAARGVYVAFLDADDIWLPDKLTAQVQALEQKPEAGAAYGFVDRIELDGERKPHTRQVADGWILETLLVWNVIGNGSNLLVRRSALGEVGEFHESLPCAEDWEMSVRLAKRFEFVCIPEPLSLYRLGTDTLSSDFEKMELGYRRALELAYRDVPADLQRLRPLSLAVFYQYLATKAWERKRRWGLSALRYGAKSVYYAERAWDRSGQLAYYPFASQDSMRKNVRPMNAALSRLFTGRGRW